MKSKAVRRKAQRAATKAWRGRNPEKVKATHRRWYKRFYAKAENRELRKAEARKEYHKIKNTKKYRERKEKSRFNRLYRITKAEVLAMFTKQRGRCAICKRKFKKLNIDHCHSSKKVRGLLCLKCNVGIGMFSDCAKNLGSAITYLRR